VKTKALVKYLLSNPAGFDWSLQGLGMLRLYLSKEARLHIWDSRYTVHNVSSLHTHPWHFVSEVVAGVVRNVRFTEVPVNSIEYVGAYPVGDVFKTADIKCGFGAYVQNQRETRLLSGGVEQYVEGQEYTQLANEIHESFPLDGTVTIVHREFTPDTEMARVFWRTGEFVSAEPRRATLDEVRAITANALERWFK
jgi:hypothetical protein